MYREFFILCRRARCGKIQGVDAQAIVALRTVLEPMDAPTRILFLVLVAGIGSSIAHGEIVVKMNNRTPTRVELREDRLFASEQIQQLKALAAPSGV